jgi:anti-sigma factor RsiW
MACSQPPPLEDDQIAAALDGVAEPAVLAHLGQCPACRARLAAAERADAQLQAALHAWDCPPVGRLADYTLGRLAAEAAVQVEAHTIVCAACAGEVGALQLLLAGDGSLAAAPAHLPPRPALPAPVVAHALPAAPGLALRGEAPLPQIAEAAHAAVVLQLRPQADGGVALIGQLVAEDQAVWDRALVEARQSGAVQSMGVVNAQGGFSCTLPSREPIDLRIVTEGAAPILIVQIRAE